MRPGSIIAWAYGLAPAFLFAVTWNGQSTPFGYFARAYALPILAIQLTIAVVWFREGFRLRNPALFPSVLTVALFALALVTAALAPDRFEAAVRMSIWTIQIVFALAVADLLQRRVLDLDQLRVAILVGFLLVFAMLVVFVATTEQTAAERVSFLPAFGNIRWFGEYAAGVAGLCALGFVRKERFALVVATAAFSMAFWTGTRGAILAVVLGFVSCTALFAEFRTPRAWLLFALSGLAGFVAALGLGTLVPIVGQGVDRMANLASSGRIEIWLDTLELIGMRPLFGWGDGQFRFHLGEAFGVGHPHNSVLQVLLAWGVVGALLCLALAVWAVPRFVRGDGAQLTPFRCAALTLAAYSLTDGTLYLVQPLSLFVLCVTIAVAAGGREEQTVTRPS